MLARTAPRRVSACRTCGSGSWPRKASTGADGRGAMQMTPRAIAGQSSGMGPAYRGLPMWMPTHRRVNRERGAPWNPPSPTRASLHLCVPLSPRHLRVCPAAVPPCRRQPLWPAECGRERLAIHGRVPRRSHARSRRRRRLQLPTFGVEMVLPAGGPARPAQQVRSLWPVLRAGWHAGLPLRPGCRVACNGPPDSDTLCVGGTQFRKWGRPLQKSTVGGLSVTSRASVYLPGTVSCYAHRHLHKRTTAAARTHGKHGLRRRLRAAGGIR